MSVRPGTQGDDASLAQFMSQAVMPGPVGLSYCYEGSFYKSLAAHGYDGRTLIGERDGAVVAAGSVARRTLWHQGKPAESGYLASLRIAPDAWGSSLLAQGYRLLKELHETEFRLPYYLTSIMRSNEPALRILTSARAGLPNYHFVGGYRTAVIPVFRNRAADRELSFQNGEKAGIDTVFHCLEQYGREKDLFSLYDPQELLQGGGMMQGISLSDFIVAFKGGEAVGVVALWNQSVFRKMLVRSYSGMLSLSGILDQLIGKLTGTHILPELETPFAPRYLSCVAVKNNNPRVFCALLIESLRQMRVRREQLLIAGLFENDRLCTVLKSFFHIPFYSNIYAVTWGKALVPAFRDCYLDVGSL